MATLIQIQIGEPKFTGLLERFVVDLSHDYTKSFLINNYGQKWFDRHVKLFPVASIAKDVIHLEALIENFHCIPE